MPWLCEIVTGMSNFNNHADELDRCRPLPRGSRKSSTRRNVNASGNRSNPGTNEIAVCSSKPPQGVLSGIVLIFNTFANFSQQESQTQLMSSPPSDAFLRDIIPAPGVRVEIRGAEWVVKRVDATSTGGHSILVAGISELVRGREARFLTEIEHKRTKIKILDPADTKLVADKSPSSETPGSTSKACSASPRQLLRISGSATKPPST